MHKEEMQTQTREFKGIELVLAMEQRKCRRLEGSLGEAQRKYELHLLERTKGTFQGTLGSTKRKTSIGLSVSPKAGADVPFTVHAQHKARKQAEQDLAEAKGKIRRLNYTIKNLLSKLKSNAADSKRKADEEISEIRQKMIYHERRSQSEISRLTMIVDNMGKDPDLNVLHPPEVYTKKNMPPVSSAVQTVETMTQNDFTRVGWGTPSERMSTATKMIPLQSSRSVLLRYNNGDDAKMSRASISLPNIREHTDSVALGPDLDEKHTKILEPSSRMKNITSNRARSIGSNQSANIETITMSPLLQRISSVGDVAAKKNQRRNSRSSKQPSYKHNAVRRDRTPIHGKASKPTSPISDSARSIKTNNASIDIDPTTPTASGLGIAYQAGTLSNNELRRIYGV